MDSSKYIVLIIVVNIALWVITSLIPRLKNRNKVFLVLSFISLWIFLSIRQPYSDTIVYENYFRTLNLENFSTIFTSGWEVLFNGLLYGIRLFTNDSQIMMTVISFITLIGPFLFIKRYSKNYLLSVVIFMSIGSFYMQFFILRQAIALSIFLMAIHFIGEKKLLKYCLGIIIAALFHKTAIILLLLYPFVNIPSSKYKNITIMVAFFLVLIFSSRITDALMLNFFDEYAGSVVFGSGISLFLLYTFMYTFYLLMKRRYNLDEKDEINMASWFTILLQFFAIQNSAFCRLANYTRDSFCILIPNSIQKLRSKDRMLFSAIIIIACICFAVATDVIKGYSIT